MEKDGQQGMFRMGNFYAKNSKFTLDQKPYYEKIVPSFSGALVASPVCL
jgi:hypothetical protein